MEMNQSKFNEQLTELTEMVKLLSNRIIDLHKIIVICDVRITKLQEDNENLNSKNEKKKNYIGDTVDSLTNLRFNADGSSYIMHGSIEKL